MSMATNKFMARQCPTHLYSAFVIRRGGITTVHRDCRNGPLPSSILSLSFYRQGEGLWLHDPVGSTLLPYRGKTLPGTIFNVNTPLFFDARKRLHAGFVLPAADVESRVSLVTFTSLHAGTLSEAVRRPLLQLGFPIPSSQAIQRALFGGECCSQPRLKQLTLQEACDMQQPKFDQHDVVEVFDSQETLAVM